MYMYFLYVDFDKDPSSKNGTLFQIVNFTCAVSDCNHNTPRIPNDTKFICESGLCNSSYCQSVCTVNLTKEDNNTTVHCEVYDEKFVTSNNATILVQSELIQHFIIE